MARICIACAKIFKLTGLLFGLLLYELVFFIGFLSLSIGATAGIKLLVNLMFNTELTITIETFTSWYILACTVQLYLGIYRKCLLPKVRQQIKNNRNVLQAIPRIIYFVIFSVAVYGICYEYEAVHNYRPLVIRPAIYSQNVTTGSGSHSLRRHKIIQMPVYTNDDFTARAPNEDIHTAMFLMMMSYIIYSSGQILGLFLLRIMNEIPLLPIIPQMYAVLSMTIVQALMTVFYSFPLLMTLVACHIFRVDGASTYMFTLCLALTIAMAAAQLESSSPFPTMSRVGPFFYFESQHRARINLIFVSLPAISYFFFKREKSFPLNASDINFVHFTFWVMVSLLHTVKSLYLATSKVIRPIPMAPVREERRALPPDYEMILPPANPRPSYLVNTYPLAQVQQINEDNLADTVNITNGNNEDLEGIEHATPKNTELDLKISAKPKRTIPISTGLNSPENSASTDPTLGNADTSPVAGTGTPQIHMAGKDSQCQIDTNKNAMVNDVLDCFAHVASEDAKGQLEEKIEAKDTTPEPDSPESVTNPNPNVLNSNNESQSESL